MSDTYSATREISKADAKLVADTFETITSVKGRLSTSELAAELVAASRVKTSPTHHLFEWDDRKAAQRQRLDHAMRIVASVYVVFAEQPERPPVRAFPSITYKGKTGPYPMRKILESRDLTAALLEDAMRDMALFTRRYEGISELKEVFEAMGRVKVLPRKKSA